MDFPQYRMYPNRKSYFKIESPNHFIEIQVIGKYYAIIHFEAKILPDRNLISDMIDLSQGHWLAITSEEYDFFAQECVQHLHLREI